MLLWLTLPSASSVVTHVVVATTITNLARSSSAPTGQAVLRCAPSAALIKPAATLASSLSRRGWPGDAELVAELEHVRDGTNSELSLLPVELDDLGDALDQSPASVSYIDLTNGVVWPGELFDVGQGPEGFDADDSTRWLSVVGVGSKAAYAVMARFIDTIENPGLASRLRDAISGPKAFRGFSAELSRHELDIPIQHINPRQRARYNLRH